MTRILWFVRMYTVDCRGYNLFNSSGSIININIVFFNLKFETMDSIGYLYYTIVTLVTPFNKN